MSDPNVNPLGVLVEWARDHRNAAYSDVFSEKEIQHREQEWEVVITHIESGTEKSGGVHAQKKKSKKNAAAALVRRLGKLSRPGEPLQSSKAKKARRCPTDSPDAPLGTSSQPAATATIPSGGLPKGVLSNPKVNPEGVLIEWARAHGGAAYEDVFEEKVINHGLQAWEVVITHKASGTSGSGGIHSKKKTSKKLAAAAVVRLLMQDEASPTQPAMVASDVVLGGALNDADANPVGALVEWSQRYRSATYPELFDDKEIRHSEQEWEVVITHIESGVSQSGGVHAKKKTSRKVAAAGLLQRLLASQTSHDDEVMNEALLGDKVLGLCFVLYLREQGVVDKGEITRHVSHYLSNAVLCVLAPQFGVLLKEGIGTHHGGTLVEQRVYRIFLAQDRDIGRTLEELRPVFETLPIFVD